MPITSIIHTEHVNKNPHQYADAAKNEATFRGGVSDVEATATDSGVNLGQGGRVVDTLKIESMFSHHPKL